MGNIFCLLVEVIDKDDGVTEFFLNRIKMKIVHTFQRSLSLWFHQVIASVSLPQSTKVQWESQKTPW